MKNILLISILLLSTLNVFASNKPNGPRIILDNPYKDLHTKIYTAYRCNKSTSNKDFNFSSLASSRTYNASVKYTDFMKTNYLELAIVDGAINLIKEVYNSKSHINLSQSYQEHTQDFQMNGKKGKITYLLNISLIPDKDDKNCNKNGTKVFDHIELVVLKATLNGKELPKRKNRTVEEL